jgi:hypothetical protein
MIPNAKTPETATKFFCINCDFKCCKESDFNRHNTTRKHIIRTNPNAILTKKSAEKNFTCNCGKNYKHMSSLCNHKKSCNFQEVFPNAIPIDMSYNIILEIVKQNQEFKELIFEQNKQLVEQNKKLIELAEQGKTINNTTNNNNTNNFNLQFFLNETCKDALNLTDFVEQIKLQLSDLDMIGRVGYVEGITKIFLRNLKDIDVCKRPIHCSDLKRETLYIKDKDAWEKENNENVKIKRAIKEVEHKNIKQLPQWREENPSAEDTDTKKHMEYQNILLEAMGGSTMENDDKKREKIIRNIAKEVIIDKTK